MTEREKPFQDSYITVQSEASGEIIIQKSRFIAYAAPCETEEEAISYLRKLREKHRDARHCCYAYVIGPNAGIMRYSDDGEPGGTAGMPMMDVSKNENAVNCCIAVVRYFGGILLGTGGLVRAYTQSCKTALEAAGLIRMELSSTIRCCMSYSLWNTVQYALTKLPLQTVDVSYAENVVITIVSRKKDSESVMEHLRNLSDGKLSCSILSEKYFAWDL